MRRIPLQLRVGSEFKYGAWTGTLYVNQYYVRSISWNTHIDTEEKSNEAMVREVADSLGQLLDDDRRCCRC